MREKIDLKVILQKIRVNQKKSCLNKIELRIKIFLRDNWNLNLKLSKIDSVSIFL